MLADDTSCDLEIHFTLRHVAREDQTLGSRDIGHSTHVSEKFVVQI